jgi:hypothetical protein
MRVTNGITINWALSYAVSGCPWLMTGTSIPARSLTHHLRRLNHTHNQLFRTIQVQNPGMADFNCFCCSRIWRMVHHRELSLRRELLMLLLLLLLLLLLSFVNTFMQYIYNHIPDTNHVSWVYIVAGILCLQFVLHVMLLSEGSSTGRRLYIQWLYGTVQ